MTARQQPNQQSTWDSEVFSLRAESLRSLQQSIQQLVGFARASKHESTGSTTCRDLAYTLNCKADAVDSAKAYTIAIVASSLGDLEQKLEFCLEQLSDSACKYIFDERRGIYFTTPESIIEGNVVFLYPGLGSAYANMLSELRDHFPEVRGIFDIVDSLCIEAGASVPPSTLIFPAAGMTREATGRSLASADFAVVAVLLAEYALYEFLQNLQVQPDAVIGCSTGEFAAITTGGAINVHRAAAMFCRLSKRVATIIPPEQFATLQSVRIFAPWTRVKSLASTTAESIYLTADLGPDHILVTGAKAAMDDLMSSLRMQGITFLPLSVAVPYHTPLVAGIIDSNHDEIQALEIERFAIPAWSCSTGSQYAADPESIRRHLTELFVQPISLHQTVLAAYSQGARIFVEVGPNDVLTSLVREILGDLPHIAVASNRASRSSLAQMHHLLAVLLTQGVHVDLHFLYGSRGASVLAWQQSQSTYAGAVAGPASGTLPRVAPLSGLSVMDAFLATTNSFYEHISAVQQTVMSAYLTSSRRAPQGNQSANELLSSARLAANLASRDAVLFQVRAAKIMNGLELESHAQVWLAPDEMEHEARRSLSQQRKNHWLLGRIAAKQAVCALLSERMGTVLHPQSVEIYQEDGQRPRVNIQGASFNAVQISISHTGDCALALATMADAGYPGIDAELLQPRQPDFGSTFLTSDEQAYIDRCSESLRDRELTKLWCAKEALYKAFGGAVQLTAFEVACGQPLGERFSARIIGSAESIPIFAVNQGDLIVAYTLVTNDQCLLAVAQVAARADASATALTF